MEYRDVVRQSIKSFLEGERPQQIEALKEEGLKYTPEYFDDLEKELLGEEAESKDDKEDKDGDD